MINVICNKLYIGNVFSVLLFTILLYLRKETVLDRLNLTWIYTKNIKTKTKTKTRYIRNDTSLGNTLFNDTLNTFYLWLYGIRHGKGSFR